MRRLAAGASILAVFATLFAVPFAQAAEADAVAGATAAATAWLAEIDAGKFGDSWEHAAPALKKAVSKSDWEGSVGGIRGQLGAVKSRKLRSANYTKSLPNAPEGEYVVMLYDTTFANKAVVETVTPMRDKDGVWRVSGYYMR
jgi:hypothetical protein